MPRCLMPIALLLAVVSSAAAADVGNRLNYLDAPCDPYYVGLDAAKLATPQWAEDGVELAIVLSIDDLRDTAKYEAFLRPIFERLKKIDGRAPVTMLTNTLDRNAPQLPTWFKEGVELGAHTVRHPCPCLQAGDFYKAKQTYDECVDFLRTIPEARMASFRMPCCDSMNSASPRFFAEIFGKTTAKKNFIEVDSSVFTVFTAADPALPRELVQQPDLQPRFAKYPPKDRKYVNYVENYPYPFVIDHLCWEMAPTSPGDWQGTNLNGPCNPSTIADMKSAIDATAIKQGLYVLCFHPHNWMRAEQVIELIDHATAKYGKRVKFYTFRDVCDRLSQNVLGGQRLRAANGQDNGVRVLDVNHDGYMDAVIGNEQVRQTRIWSPQAKRWIVSEFPLELVSVDAQGERRDAGVRFGVLQKSGAASILVGNSKAAGVWHFDGKQWVPDPRGSTIITVGEDKLERIGVEFSEASPLVTTAGGRDRGVRLVDLDRDGMCELVVANDKHQGVYRWQTEQTGGWRKLPFTLPGGAVLADAQGRDAGCRLVDIDEDGHPDVVFSNPARYLLHIFVNMTEGWSRKILAAERAEGDAIPTIVRADGTNNGVWFKYRHLWVQNEDTGSDVESGGKSIRVPVDSRWYTSLLDGDIHPPPRSPADSLASMLPRPGMKVELMAAEPLVLDPIDIAWGPDGRAWVVEMTDYPLGLDDKGKIGGRVRFLEDTDGDGRYDKSTVFLEPIGYPTGIIPWRKGVIVTTAPEVFYAEDTDGDGRADLRKALYTGFREGNQQHRVNHPRWGLDNWIYLANGDSGGQIKSTRTGQTVEISGRDLRIRPDEGLLDPETGQTQYGRNRDDWGNHFGCNNNTPAWYYTVADHYIRRNPHAAAPPGHVDLTTAHGVWSGGRVITHCFIPQPTPAEGKPGYWTCACGTMVYRDELLGPEFAGNTFTADGVYNTVHRMIVQPDGVLFKGQRPPDEQKSEFLSSADPWFRPTTIHTGPDGALWVVDMYRLVIEHPEWIDAKLVKTLNLREGCDKGRIYRIYPVDKKPRAIPRLDKLDAAGLVAALDTPNGWQRDLAHQMLVWRADPAAVKPLEAMANRPRPLARLHALCALDGLNALRAEVVQAALADPHPGVRCHAVRLIEGLVTKHPALGEAALKLVDDPDLRVQMQLAYSLGEWRDPRAGQALGQLARKHAADPYLSAAVMSSAVPHVDAMLALLRDERSAAGKQWVAKLEKLAAAIKAEPELTAGRDANKAGGIPRQPAEPNRQRIEKVLGRAATVDQVQKTLAKYSPVLGYFGDPDRGKKVFVEATCATCHRFQSAGQQIGPDLETLVDRSSPTLLVAVCDPNRAVLERFVEYIAVTKDGITQPGMLVEETGNAITLVDRDAKKHVILRKDLDELIYTGLSHMPEGLPDKMTLQQMADLFAFLGGKGPPPKQLAGNKPELVRLDRDLALNLRAAAAEVYGPDITFDARQGTLSNWTCPAALAAWNVRIEREAAFEVTLDWASAKGGNRFALQVGGQVVLGEVGATGGPAMFQQESIGHVHLPPGQTRVTLRPEPPLTGSLMELRGVKLTRVEANGAIKPKPQKVKPGKDGVLQLHATQAEIDGQQLVLEAKYRNLGMWLNARDSAAWTILVAKPGSYEVWFDWACDPATADNEFRLQVKDQKLQGRVPSTGTWDEYQQAKFGEIRLEAGEQRLSVRPAGQLKNALMDLRAIKLVPK